MKIQGKVIQLTVTSSDNDDSCYIFALTDEGRIFFKPVYGDGKWQEETLEWETE